VSKVVIAIPVYNEETFIARTIESALNQDYKDLSIVVSDNCSTDNSLEIAQSYANKYSNIRVISPNENIGAIGNFIFVLNEVKSDYFMWLGAHDTIQPSYISNAVAILDDKPDVEMVFHRSQYIDENDLELETTKDGSDIARYDTSDYNRISNIFDLTISTVIHGLFRLDNLQKIPTNNNIRFDLQILFYTATFGKIYKIDEVGFNRRKMRNEETFEQRKKRLASYKMYFDKSIYQYDMINSRIDMLSYLTALEKKKLKIKFFKRFYHFLSMSEVDFTKDYIKKTKKPHSYAMALRTAKTITHTRELAKKILRK